MAVEKIEAHRDLVVWQKAMDMTVLLYRWSARLQPNEAYRLVTHITRARHRYPQTLLRVSGFVLANPEIKQAAE